MSPGFDRPLPEALRGGPLVIAHRGGSALAPENTLPAFRQAVERWAADMIELDVHASADGACVVIHDPTVDRTTDGTGAVAALTLAELRTLDAGWRFTSDGGATWPFRGSGATIPTLDEVLDALPDTRFTVEVKDGRAQAPLLEILAARAAAHRVVVAGMHERERTMFDRYPGPISASTRAVTVFRTFQFLGLGAIAPLRADVLQVPEHHRGTRVVTPGFVRAARRRSVPVHVWTVDAEADMRRLLDWGVDGVITDRPDRLDAVLRDRGIRPGT